MTDKKLIPITGVDQVGIIRDVPAHALPPNAWSDGRNIYFKNGTVYKRQGTVQAFSEITNAQQDIAHISLTGLTLINEYSSRSYRTIVLVSIFSGL